MKTRILTLALFGLMSISFMACNEDPVVPSNDISIEQSDVDCECEGGLSDREEPNN